MTNPVLKRTKPIVLLTPHPGPTAIELRHEPDERRESVSLSSHRVRRGRGRGGPSCLRLALGVSRRLPLSPALSPLVPHGEREKARRRLLANSRAGHPGLLPVE